MSRDIGTIFSAPMVLAHQEGRKTMTRRLAWRTKWNNGGHIPDGGGGQMDFVEPHEVRIGPSSWQKVKPGDRLWVRENFWHYGIWLPLEDGSWHFFGRKAPSSDLGVIEYMGAPIEALKAPSRDRVGYHLRPSIYMPREASRITDIVTATKVERLQAITFIEAKAEGVSFLPGAEDPRDAFRTLWQSLHGKDSWDANPEVVALTFTVHHQNIDAMEKAA